VEDVAHEALREAIMVAALEWLGNGP
jgi:hypothetical protein